MLKKIIAVGLCLCMACGVPSMKLQATEPEEMPPLSEPLPNPQAQETEAIPSEGPDMDDGSYSLFGSGSAILGEADPDNAAALTDYEIELERTISTESASAYWSFSAHIPEIISFFDNHSSYNVVYENADESNIVIQRYSTEMRLVDKIRIPKRYPMFGTIVTDNDGYYYMIWGQSDPDNTNCVTMCVSKYDYNGNYQNECTFQGYDTAVWDDASGTAFPFRHGNCSALVSNGILVCNYARQMYNGHQSNYVFYIDCNSMSRLGTDSWAPYCSHSFDQRVLSLSNGSYLIANQGDAYPRSFKLSLICNDDYSIVSEIVNFHFREGADRDHGYNETYAQMGGMAETANSYVFCGSSERTLSAATAPTGGVYCGHSEARDLFVQFLKKDFYSYSGSSQYMTAGEPRRTQGQRPATAQTELFLSGNEVDYGILWLTAYDDEYYVNNPKIVATDDNKIVVMWEKLSYSTHTGISCYAILNEDGTVYRNTHEILGARLAGNTDPVLQNGRIYWTASNEYGAHIYSLDLSGTQKIDPYVGLKQQGDKWIFVRRGGIKDPSVNGLISYNDEWFYVQKGEVDTSAQGFVDYDGGRFYLADGRVCKEYSGLIQDPESSQWYFIANGQFQQQYSGLALYDGEWFLLVNGILYDSFSGLCPYDGREFLVADGHILTSYSGLFEDRPYEWYFIAEGQVSDYTGLALYDDKWFYIKRGKLDIYYTGYVEYDGELFYVDHGQVY